MNKKGLLLAVSLALGCLALLFGLRTCARARGESTALHAAPEAGAADGSAPLCRRGPNFAILGEGLVRGDLLIGQAVELPGGGYAIGLVRRGAQRERVASVAILTHDVRATTFVDLGPVQGDAPPPRPFVRGAKLFAARYGRSSSKEADRTLAIVRIDRPEGKATPLSELPQQSDESLAFDVVSFPSSSPSAPGLIAWDEDALSSDAGTARDRAGKGVIKVIPIVDEARLGDVVTVSARAADVERPRAIARAGGGFWVGWIARRVDSRGEADPKGLEGPGEDPSFSRVEIARLDDSGKRIGDVQQVTSDGGHVTAFEWLAGEGGKLDLVFRDDAGVGDEEKEGRILQISIVDDIPQAARPVADPVRQGIFLDGPLDTAAEPALDGQSVLVARSTGSGETLLLAVGASENSQDQAEAHIVLCRR